MAVLPRGDSGAGSQLYPLEAIGVAVAFTASSHCANMIHRDGAHGSVVRHWRRGPACFFIGVLIMVTDLLILRPNRITAE